MKSDEIEKIPLQQVDTELVRYALQDASWMVIDTRNPDTFNGWCLGGEKVKGHIAGATDYSAQWIRFPYINPWTTEEEYRSRFEDALKYRDITPNKKIILYDTNENDAYVVADFLRKKGFQNLYYYNFSEWSEETKWLPDYEMFVPVQWVKDVIDGKKVEFYDGGPYKIFEVSETDEPYPEFFEGHIPGSVHVSVNEFQTAPEWCTNSDEKLEKFACNNGITVDTTVIIYALGYTGASHVLAAVLRYMGVKHVHCINGSSYHWQYHGYEMEKRDNPKQRVESFGTKIPGRPKEIVKIDEVKKMLQGKVPGQLVDMRSWEQYTGQTSGYSHVEKAGRIPGTKWCCRKNWYLNPDETIGNSEEMINHWKECGVDLGERIVFFCGSGAW